jgi:VCBS repeat-containing protein
MRTHPLLRVSFLLSVALAMSTSVPPPDAWARTVPAPMTTVWDSADVTGDGVIDVRDVFFVVRHFGERCTAKRRAVPGDLNRDCRVDGLDLGRVLREAHRARRTPANAPPQPKADAASTLEDVAVTIAVLANDVDPDGDALRLVSAGAGSLGTTAVNSDGTVRYTPARDANGTDTFSYTVADARGLTATQTVRVAIAAVNDPPAVTATVSASSGTAPLEVIFEAIGTDVDRDPLTYTWSFGDGSVGTGPHPAHTYADAGTYNATVVVSDGAATSLASLGVSVEPAPAAARPSGYVVDTVAGTGVAGRSGERGSATSAQLFDPRQVVVAPDGSFYVAEAQRIVRVDPAGTLTGARALPGGGSGDEGPSIAVTPDGTVYYTDADVVGSCNEGGYYSEIRVRRLSPSGAEDPVVATWAGGGYLGPCSPSAKLAIDGAGSFYLSAAYYVAKLLPGTTGEAAWSSYVADFAYALAADHDGVFVGGYASVLRIGADGTSTPFAGTGAHGSTGDGGPALDAHVGAVAGLTVCPDGTVTFLEFDLTSSGTPRIREVTPDGLIATIGGGISGFNGDGRPALETAFGFSLSAGIASLPGGGFYVADRDNARVRRLLPTTGAAAPAAQQQ